MATTPPNAGTPQAVTLIMTANQIREAWARGEVTPLSPGLPEFVFHDGSWWAADDTEYLRITDPDLASFLDTQRTKMDSEIALIVNPANTTGSV